MGSSRPWKDTNADLRRRTQVAAPAVEEIEERLYQLLQPIHFKPISGRRNRSGQEMRERLLTLPVMVVVVTSLVYRQISGLSELLRVADWEGLLWLEPFRVSQQAVSQRLRQLPAYLFEEIFEQVVKRLSGSPKVVSQQWQGVQEQFEAIWVADGSTLEELRRRTKSLQQHSKTVLAGKMMMVVELLSHRPVALQYTEQSSANDKSFCDQLLKRLPVGGLLVFDLGFFQFAWFDGFSQTNKFFLTRLREKTAYRRLQVLAQGEHYRDEIIELGLYRSHPCEYPVRLVSVLWGTTWYQYLTNVLDPQQLTPQQVCDLYRRRWRIEDAFNLTKRLLGLSYLWVGDTNGVQIQLFATWIFYALLNQLCAEVALTLQQPLERISMEMVFRGLYHYAQARHRGNLSTVVAFLCQHHKRLGIVKATRKRHRIRDAQWHEIWGEPALS